MRFPIRHSLLATLCLVAVALCQSPGGINRADMDPTCKPCDDFWRYANGGWVDKNPIPARQASWGTFPVLSEANRERLKVILDTAVSSNAAANSNERKIGDFYASCMDTAAINARGLAPLQPDLDRVAEVKSAAALVAVLNEFQTRGGGGGRGPQAMTGVGPFTLMGQADAKDSSRIIASVGGSGLSLPDRDYYFKDDERTARIRDEFLKHVSRMMVLAGSSQADAEKAAATVMAIEKSFAEVTRSGEDRRDPYARYHMVDLAGLEKLAPAHDWKGLLARLKIAPTTPVNVAEPDFLTRYNQMLGSVAVEDWKTWVRWRLLRGAAASLSTPFEKEAFQFMSTTLSGIKEQAPRWQTCANAVDTYLGDAIGELFVRKHFPPAAQKRMATLVENLRDTLRVELQNADWLNPETRKNAIAKLNSFEPKIGFPNRWRDYSAVKLSRGNFYENVRSTAALTRAYQLAKIGKPVDRNDWTMTPPTVNAYYNASLNEIVFPAGILQPPFFDLNADDAVNYGAIGAVIGHEMGHGFDDQGSKYDAQGNLKNWWTDSDRAEFDKRAGCVIDEFNTLEVGDGLHHKGKLVVGEAMGDLGGLTIAYKAYHRSLNGKPGPTIDGYTADQRFFLSFARVWTGSSRPEATRLLLNTNAHPLPRFRTIGTLQNMPEFHQAFGCKPGDFMVRPKEKQCKLW